jgi:serine/threonine-protein kinase
MQSTNDGTRMRLDGRPYRLRKRIKGGMATVFMLEQEVEQHSLVHRRFVAAKTFEPGRDKRQIRNELENWIRLSHPNILVLNAIGTLNDDLAAIAPWRLAGSLADILRGGRFSLQRTRQVLLDVTEGLRYAHDARGLLHLDIKPDNVFYVDTIDRYEIGDWGISSMVSARDISQSMSPRPQISGTLPYMAPERFRGTPHGIASDLFSLGIMAVVLICGRLPFGSRDIVGEIMTARYVKGVAALSAALPADWRALIALLTAPDWRGRPKKYSVVLSFLRSLSH